MNFFNIKGLRNSRETYELIKDLVHVDDLRDYHEGHVLNSIDDAILVEADSITQAANRMSIWIAKHFGSVEGLHVEHVRLGARRFEIIVFRLYGESSAPRIVIFEVTSLFG